MPNFMERPTPRLTGLARDTQFLFWDGFVFEKVGTRQESGFPEEAFPLEKRPVDISVKKLSSEGAKHFRKGRR